LNYQDAEQFWCKLTASDSSISQLACYANFEQQHPPAQLGQAMDQMGDALMAVTGIVFCVLVIRAALRVDTPPNPKPTQRIEPEL
jgi:hypothetical protein